MGMALSATGEYWHAERYLLRARKKSPLHLNIALGLLQNAIFMQNPQRISRYSSLITNGFKLVQLKSFFAQRTRGYQLIDGMLIDLKDDLIRLHLAENLEETAHQLGSHDVRDAK